MSAKKKAFFLLILLLLCIVGILVFGRSGPDRVIVLNYHQVNDHDHNFLTVTGQEFDDQMRYLAESGYHVITPMEMSDAFAKGEKLPDNPVIVSLDDGYMDNYEVAYPILQKYGVKATIFLISDYVSTYPNYLTWDIVREMQDSGLVDFESHTLSHVELASPELSSEKIFHELETSRLAIEWHLEKPVRFIAYPCGTYHDEVQRLTREAGYLGAFTVHYGLNDPQTDKYSWNRVPILGGHRYPLLCFKLRLRYAPIFSRLEPLHVYLQQNGYTRLAKCVFIP